MRLIPVKRGEVDLKATKECLSALKQNEILFIFPEGTRNRESDEMLPFKTGPAMFALKTKTPIRPFYIQKAKKAKKIYYCRRGVRAFRFLRGGTEQGKFGSRNGIYPRQGDGA